MDITGHFESASCVIEVDRSDTLAQVKEKLVVELGVPRARHVGVRMRGGGDIGNDLRICDTAIDEGCAVELYCTGADITPGLLTDGNTDYERFTLSPCDRYLAATSDGASDDSSNVSIFNLETHERLCVFSAMESSFPAFSPCSGWISSVGESTQCAEVRHVETGALEHSFGGANAGYSKNGDGVTAWSPCGTKLLSCGVSGCGTLQQVLSCVNGMQLGLTMTMTWP